MPSILKYLGKSVAAAAIVAAGVSTSYAQIGNSSAALSSARDATVSAGPTGVGSAGEPSGVGTSRLPLTTPEIMPFTNNAGTPSAAETPGTSFDPAVGGYAYGTAAEKWPYTESRVAVLGVPFPSAAFPLVPVTSRPYRWTGKLWMRFGTSWFVCSASLIKRAVLITAAHCVHNYGTGAAGFADEVRWYPANVGLSGPWGYFSGATWRIPTVYLNGTDTCQAGAIGVVCNNDIATVTLARRNNLPAGYYVGGWNGYGWNGYSFVTSPAFGNHYIGHITQLGYPVAFDLGRQMQRNDSMGKYITGTGANGKLLKNTQLGSPLTGGSSGGPWIVNFGTLPAISSAASHGIQALRNIVVGVTSWGYVAVGVGVQGASWFGQNAEFPLANYGGRGAGNIGKIVSDTCVATPSAC